MPQKILIADDSSVTRQMLKEILKDEYEVLEAANGREAIALMYKEYRTLAAVLLDIGMPVMDGFQFLKLRAENTVLSQIPVIVISSDDDDATKEKAKDMYAHGYITKPFDPSKLKSMIKNIIEQNKTPEQIRLSSLDRLTKLLSRHVFFNISATMISNENSDSYILSCINVDGFKVINDQYGTEIGDKVLKHIAKCFGHEFTELGGIVCRITADDFAALYPEKYADCETIKNVYEKAISPKFLDRKIRIRIGRYLINDTSLSASTMYDRAKIACDSIKGNYEKYIEYYSDSMRNALLREQEVISSMDDALKNHEFKVWLQPQFNHMTGAIIGAEALVRWEKDGKFVSPAEFIPIFEKNGFIYEMDKYIWEQVCILLHKQLNENKNLLPISVNVSRKDLLHDYFTESLTGIIKKYNLPYDMLRLEVTESAFSDSTNHIIEKVNELIKLGFTVEIDDFGSGYSSLNTLKDVPAEILKLDMRFFENTENSERGGNIIESVVRMAKWLGMAVIAEGVEEKEQADYLKSIGCYYIQGYYYAKPMPVSEYEALLTESQKETKLTRLETLDNLNNSKFWDPKSMETLIFNSYVGGACILEKHGDKIEILRTSDKFSNELGSVAPQIIKGRFLGLRKLLNVENIRRLKNCMQSAIDKHNEAACEIRLSDGKKDEYINVTLRVIARAAERWLFYCVINNITAQRNAEKERAESAKKLEIIMGNINGGVSAILIDDDGNSRFVFNNEKYYELYGYTREQAVKENLDVMTMIAPEDFPVVLEKIKKLKKDKKPVLIDYVIKKRDGSRALLRANASLMSIEGYGDEVITSVLTDITEKKSLESQLQAIVTNINGGVSATVIRNGNPEFVVVNDRFFEILGYESREQYEKELPNKYTGVHPDDRERIINQFETSDGGKKQYTMEYRIIRRDGEIRYIRNNISVVYLFGIDEPVQLSVANDITEQKIAQIKERNVSKQLSTVMDNIHGGITATVYHDDNNIEMIFSNNGFYELYGYTKEQLEEEVPNMLDLILPEDRQKTMEAVARIVKNRGSETYEYRCYKRDGSIMWTRVTNSVISLEEIGNTVLLGVVADVTLQRTAALQMAKLTDQLRAVTNSMSNGMTAVAIHGNETEFLFANNRYYEMHGITKEEYQNKYLADSLILVYPDDREQMCKAVLNATKIGTQIKTEYRILRPDGIVRWVKAVIDVTTLVGIDVPVQVTIFTDITEEKEANSQLEFLNTSAHDILAQPDANKAIDETLEKLINYFEGDRAYVIELDYNTHTSRNTYELCADGIISQSEKVEGLPFTKKDFWYKKLSKNELFIIENVEKIRENEKELYELLSSQDIHSIILAPHFIGGKLVGFSGVDNPKKDLSKVSRLKALGDYFALLIGRRNVNAKILNDANEMKHLINDTPGGFMRMEIHADKNPTIISLNEGICRMLDMPKDEIMQEYGNDVYKCLLLEDIESTSKESAEAFATCGQFESRCRLRGKDGKLIWVRVNARFIKDENGKLFLNSYFSDITEQKKSEDLQIELLDNLAFGAALYEFDGKALKVIHLNKRYWELVERQSKSFNDINVLNAVHPDDAKIIGIEVASAIRQGRNVEVNVRVLCGESGYKPFHVIAAITKKDSNKYILYASYSVISENTMSIQEMIPIALSTMMSASDEISYVKDKDLRYICCSEALAKMAELDSSRDIIGKSAYDLFDKKYADKFTADDKKIIETGKSAIDTTEKMLDKCGSIHLLSTSKYPVMDASGNTIGVYCIAHDVTRAREKESQLKLLSSTIAGGLAAYSITKQGIKTLYFNDGYYEFSGYTREEYTELVKKEVLALIVPEDRPKVLEMVHDFINSKQDGKTEGCTYRCLTKDGTIVWMSLKAVLSEIDEDNYVLNVVQLDVTEQMEAQKKQIELLDNLPCGAGLYRYDGKMLSAIHINKRYAEMTARTLNSENTELAPTDYIHPGDHKIITEELADAIKHNRNAQCDIRILYGESKYRTFHLDVRILKQPDKTYMLYVAYSTIPEQEMNFKNALPFIFSTIMESSTDLAFVKDINFEYLCASKTFIEFVGLKSEKELIGKTDYDLFSKEMADKFRKDDTDIFVSKKPQTDVIEIIPSSDGEKHYTKTSKHLLKNLTGEIVGIYGMGRDITEVREAYKQLSLMTNSISGGLGTFRCSPKKIDMTFCNDGLCELSGYSKDEFENLKIDPLSLVFDEDRPCIFEKLQELYQNEDEPVSFMVRIHTKSGSYKWTSCTANVTDSIGNALIVNTVLADITEQQEEKELLRLHEEEYRLATEHANRTICRYDIKNHTLKLSDEVASRLSLPKYIEDVPYGRVKLGLVSEDTKASYIAFYERIIKGEKKNVAIFCKKLITGWRWIEAHATTIFDKYGNAVSAVVSFTDVTEQQEKEAVYKKWQQNLKIKDQASYTLFRINLNKNGSYDTKEGNLFDCLPRMDKSKSFNEIVNVFAENYLFNEEKNTYLKFLNSDTMLASYYRGIRVDSIEFRLKHPDGKTLWIKLSVELVEYPNSTDVLAYLLYENITNEKSTELQIIQKAETDPLTGVLNRVSFENRVNQIIKNSNLGTMHAFFMMDIDGFKLVNDVFGHGAGDEELINIAEILTKATRKGDLIGRLGGDEFVVFLSDIPSEAIAKKKAKQICTLTQKAISAEVHISASVGIAVFPQDGVSFDELYKQADKALYYVKENGKNNFALSHDKAKSPDVTIETARKQRRMLIVDDNKVDHEIMKGIFKNEYVIEEAADGATALMKIHHFGRAISVVLLDLCMPGMDGYAVLEKMQQNIETSTIPVIVVSGDDERETALKVIKGGASDFITKPIDAELLKIRVESAISKADNERLRAQNSFLSLQNDEITGYNAVLEKSGMLVISLDWGNSTFTYNPSVSKHLWGTYDNRSLWKIMLSDMVADSNTVQKMQQLIYDLADDRNKTESSMTVTLKTTQGKQQRYEMNVFKLVNDYGLTNKMLLAFKESNL